MNAAYLLREMVTAGKADHGHKKPKKTASGKKQNQADQ